jgi:hypothetical protein
MSTPETSTLTTGTNEQPTLKRKLFVGMQHVLPQREQARTQEGT